MNTIEHLRRAGRLGGRALIAKYGRVGGDKEKRKIAWRAWWQSGGRKIYGNFYDRKPIKYPRKSVKLAEFVGIMMGDGGISARQVVVTLNSETDIEFAQYYRDLCFGLFGIIPHTVKLKCKAINLVISRTDLVEFCHTLGLPIGHKIRQGLDVPDWIKRNSAYARECLRGLVDTDGSVFTHRYRSAGKFYQYKKLDFCTLSKPLLKSDYDIFIDNGMHPYISQGKDLRLESRKDVERYFQVIGTSNPKHLKRYQK